jgi:signal transduction histidine kinase
MVFHPEPCDLAALLHKATAAQRGDAATRKVTVRVDVDPAIGTVIADAARLEQIVHNYLANALELAGADGRVTLRARMLDASRFTIEVEDTGAGFAATELDRMFAGTAGKALAGAELRLALVRRLTEALGGDVGVTSELGAGSTFSVILPREATR